MQKRKQRRREAFAIHKQKIINATILHVYPRCSHFEKTRKRMQYTYHNRVYPYGPYC